MITAAAERNIRLIVQTTITSHTGLVYCVEYTAQGTPPHYGFSLLTSVECACVDRALSLCVLYSVRCLEGITFQMQ